MKYIKERIHKFMIGRHGMDEFNRFLNTSVLIMIIIGFFVHFMGSLAVAIMFFQIFRMFSKNSFKRHRENLAYIRLKTQLSKKAKSTKCRITQRKTHCFFTCPSCKKTVRVPKGKGKITITCPVCKTRFDRKS